MVARFIACSTVRRTTLVALVAIAASSCGDPDPLAEIYSLDVVLTAPTRAGSSGTLYVTHADGDAVTLRFDTGTMNVGGASYQLACANLAARRNGLYVELAPGQHCSLEPLPAGSAQSGRVAISSAHLRIDGRTLAGSWPVEVHRGTDTTTATLDVSARVAPRRLH